MEVTIEQATDVLAAGSPLIFPTDTVWGIGVAVEHCADCQALAKAKGRDEGKPIAWLVASAEALDEYGRDVPGYARALAEAFWPGPLTLVVRASSRVPAAYASAAGTIGLRMPQSDCALALVRAAASPIAATSANFSGSPDVPATEPPDKAFAQACGAPVLRWDEGADLRPGPGASRPIPSGAASAVVDCAHDAPRLLRAGTISASEMQGVCGMPFHSAPRP